MYTDEACGWTMVSGVRVKVSEMISMVGVGHGACILLAPFGDATTPFCTRNAERPRQSGERNAPSSITMTIRQKLTGPVSLFPFGMGRPSTCHGQPGIGFRGCGVQDVPLTQVLLKNGMQVHHA